MIDSVQDISDNAKHMNYPYLLLLASSDIVVDNKGAQDFHKVTKTHKDKKQLK